MSVIPLVCFALLIWTAHLTPPALAVGVTTKMRGLLGLLGVVCWKCWNSEDSSTLLVGVSVVALDWICVRFANIMQVSINSIKHLSI